ncbi:MAG: KdsC family phosphatase [Fusobacteriota bacterium]
MEDKSKHIKMIILDIDGTLTDGTIYINNNGVESKGFNAKDGLAIVEARKQGIPSAIITGRESTVVEIRARELGITEVHQGVENKLGKIREIAKKYNLEKYNFAYIGDDVNDLPALKKVGFRGTPYDGVQEVKEVADFISSCKGGHGAVREFIEYILKSQGIWNYN